MGDHLSAENRDLLNRIWKDEASLPGRSYNRAINRALDAARSEGPSPGYDGGKSLGELSNQELAERLCEVHSGIVPGEAAWPYISRAERDGWHRVADEVRAAVTFAATLSDGGDVSALRERVGELEAGLWEILDGMIASRNDICVDDWIEIAESLLSPSGVGVEGQDARPEPAMEGRGDPCPALPADALDAGWKAAAKDLIDGLADERERTIALTTVLREARAYVVDALEAHEHSDGRELLERIDKITPEKCFRCGEWMQTGPYGITDCPACNPMNPEKF